MWKIIQKHGMNYALKQSKGEDIVVGLSFLVFDEYNYGGKAWTIMRLRRAFLIVASSDNVWIFKENYLTQLLPNITINLCTYFLPR